MTLLITGAAGVLGRKLFAALREDYEIRLTDIVPVSGLEPGVDFVRADLSDSAQVDKAVEGVDAIIHLGGVSTEGSFEDILPASIVGTRNVFDAAARFGVTRVVFPSSNQAIGYYPAGRRLAVDVTMRPTGWYGVSKAFGEAVGALYADKYGLRVLVIRIGRHADQPENVRGLSLWLSLPDLVQLVRIGLEHEDIHFDIVYGISDNIRGYFDNERAEELGYRPESRAEDYVDHAYARQAERPVNPFADRFVGGPLAALDYRGDPQRSGR